jgi:hypothetical protein
MYTVQNINNNNEFSRAFYATPSTVSGMLAVSRVIELFQKL